MSSPLDSWALDREVVLTRIYDHPRERVFAAWTDAAALEAWHAPKGYSCTTHDADIREGGHWRFDMIGPDGKVWPNLIVFLEIDAPRRIVMDHGGAEPDDPARFRVTVTFDAEPGGRTALTLRQLHPTAAQREGVIGFGAVSLGTTTLDKLDDWLARG